jgi:acyl carrier protein
MARKMVEVEAESLEEARKQVESQLPRGFSVLSEQVISDDRPKTVNAVAETTEAAFAKAQGEIPNNADILDKKELAAPERRLVSVEAADEENAKSIAHSRARREFGSTAVVKSLRLMNAGSKGFLGIGAKPNQYQAEILQQGIVEVTYKTQAKIRAEIGRKVYKLGLSDPSHPARRPIDEASSTADQTIRLSAIGDAVLSETNSAAAMQLVSAIERALEKEPDDLDLLVAKSGALCCAMQFKTAEDVIDHILSIDPEHFEARQRKDYWLEWEHLFQYPSWSTAAKTLDPVMSARFQHQHVVQLIRDGLQIGIAIVRPAQSREFPMGLSNRTPCKWVPIWSDTPYGAIVAHYAVIEDNPADPWKGESFLPTGVPEKATPASGYWLLQRMCHASSCFIILTDGHNVLYNSRYVFPDTLRSTLSAISDKMESQSARHDSRAFQQASQWHMNNFDMRRVR